MENISQWVGIDISKATLDVYLRPLGKAMKVANTKEDISKLVETLKSYTVKNLSPQSVRRLASSTLPPPLTYSVIISFIV